MAGKRQVAQLRGLGIPKSCVYNVKALELQDLAYQLVLCTATVPSARGMWRTVL